MYVRPAHRQKGKIVKVNLAHTQNDQIAAFAALKMAFGRRWRHFECLPLSSTYQPKGFTEVKLYMASCERGVVLFCQLGRGPIFRPQRWLNITKFKEQDKLDKLGVKGQWLVSSRNALLSHVSDVESSAGKWSHDALFAEFQRRVESWKVQVSQWSTTDLRHASGTCGPFTKWGVDDWFHVWTHGFKAPQCHGYVTPYTAPAYHPPGRAHAPPRYRRCVHDDDDDEYDEDEEEEGLEYDVEY